MIKKISGIIIIIIKMKGKIDKVLNSIGIANGNGKMQIKPFPSLF